MENKIDLDNPEFQNLWKLINFTRNSVFLTGKAGTGKSTFLKYITSHTRKKYVVLAPTGIAAVNVGGMTMHSFFGLPFKPLMPDDPEFSLRNLRKRMKYSKPKQKLIKALELVIIDEISMVRADIIDFIDKLLRVYGGNMREPFGGKQLLLVGDLFQLEPVVTADMRDILRKHYETPMFFSANVFKEMNIASIELRKVYRQSDSDFIAMLDRIRMGAAGQADIDALNRRIQPAEKFDPDSSKLTMTLAARRETVDHINEECLSQIKRPARVYSGEITGDFPESSLPTSRELQLKEGAQVVFIKNDRNGRWVNGSLAKVTVATPSTVEVQMETGEKHIVEIEGWQNVRYQLDEKTGKIKEEVIGQFFQYPLRLAWALTIHKSQGLTFNNVAIDLGQGAFSSGQTYVALSRCRSMEGLALRSTIAQRDVFINPAIVRFSHTFNDQHAIELALEKAHADDCYRRASEAANEGDYTRAFDLFVEAMRHRSELYRDGAMRLARRKLGVIARQGTRIKELEDEVAKLKKRHQELAYEYISMGHELLADGYDFQPALGNFDKALSLDPDNLEALLGRASSLSAMGDSTEAIATLLKASSAHPDEVEPMLRLSTAYLADDEYSSALDWALKAFDLDKKNPVAAMQVSTVYDRAGQEDEAETYRLLAEKLKQKNGKRKK